MATYPSAAKSSVTARMCELTPKISCSTTMAPRGVLVAGASQASNSWPSRAISRVNSPFFAPFMSEPSRLCGSWIASGTLHDRGHTHAAGRAHRDQSAACMRQLVEQFRRHAEDSRAGGRERMPHRDAAALDVQLAAVDGSQW